MGRQPKGKTLLNATQHEERLKREFPERLRRLREAAGEKQGQLAKALGFSETAYQLWEKEGGNLPNALNLHKLALHFKVSADYLLGLQEETSRPAAGEESDEKRRQVFYHAWHGKNWNAPEVGLLLPGLCRSGESLERCYDRVITDVLLEGRPEDLPPLSYFRTQAAQQAKEEIERLFRERSPEHARQVTIHVLDLGQVPSDRFRRNILGMQGAELMKERMKDRLHAFTLAVSGGWMAREVLSAPNLERGDIENVTVIPLTLGRTLFDETASTTIIGAFAFRHGDYGVKPLDLEEKGPQRIELRASAIDLAFMGLGAVEPESHKSVFPTLLAEKGVSQSALKAEGVIGNVLFHLIREDPSGLSWDTYKLPPDKQIAVNIDDPAGDEVLHTLSLDVLEKLVKSEIARIVVLVKDQTRVRILRAALEMRWANTVICSLTVADELRKLLISKPLI